MTQRRTTTTTLNLIIIRTSQRQNVLHALAFSFAVCLIMAPHHVSSAFWHSSFPSLKALSLPSSFSLQNRSRRSQRSQRPSVVALNVRIPRRIQLLQWDEDDFEIHKRFNSELESLPTDDDGIDEESSYKPQGEQPQGEQGLITTDSINSNDSIYYSIDGDYIDPGKNPLWYETDEATINDVTKYKEYKGPKDVQMLFKEQLTPIPNTSTSTNPNTSTNPSTSSSTNNSQTTLQGSSSLSNGGEEVLPNTNESNNDPTVIMSSYDTSNVVEGNAKVDTEAGTRATTDISSSSDVIPPPPRFSIPPSPTDVELFDIGWARAFDPNTGNYYYYSLDQSQTTWENPLMFLGKEGTPPSQVVVVVEEQEDQAVQDQKEEKEEGLENDLVDDDDNEVMEEEDEPIQEIEIERKEYIADSTEDEGSTMEDGAISMEGDSINPNQDLTFTNNEEDITSGVNQRLSVPKQSDATTLDRMTFEKIHLDSPKEEEEEDKYNDFFLQVYDEYSKQGEDLREDSESSLQDDNGPALLNQSQVQELVQETLRQDYPYNDQESLENQPSDNDALVRKVDGRKVLGKAEIQRLVEEALQQGYMDDQKESRAKKVLSDENLPMDLSGRTILANSEVQRIVEETLQEPEENNKLDLLENTTLKIEEIETEERVARDNISGNIESNKISVGENLLQCELDKLKSDFDSVQLGIETIMNLANMHKAWYRNQLLFSFEVKELESSFRSVQTGLGLVLSLFNVTSEESLELENFPQDSFDIELKSDDKKEQRGEERTVEREEDALSKLAQKADLPFFLSQIKDYDDSKEKQLVMSSFKDLKSLVETFEKDLVRLKAMDELTTYEKNYRMTKELQELLWEVSKLTSTSNKIQFRIGKRKKNYQARLSLDDFLAKDLEPLGDFLQRTENALKIERLGWVTEEKDMKRRKKELEQKIKNVEDEQNIINAGINALEKLIKEKEDIITRAREEVEDELSKWSDEREQLEIENAQLEILLIEEEENIESIELSLQESKETKSEWIVYQEIMLQDRTVAYEKLLQSEKELKELITDIDDVTESLVSAMRVILKKNDEFILFAKKEVDKQLVKLDKRVQQFESIKKQFFQISLSETFSRSSSSQLQKTLDTEKTKKKKEQIINPIERVFSIFQTSQLLPRVKKLSDARRDLDKLKETLEELMYAKDTSYNSLYNMDVVEIKSAKGTLCCFISFILFRMF